MSLCKASNSMKCIHKRNAGKDIVKCAIDASKTLCCFAETAEERKAKIDAADKE